MNTNGSQRPPCLLHGVYIDQLTARLLWPAVAEWWRLHMQAGATVKLGAARDVVAAWAQLVAAPTFATEHGAGVDVSGGARSPSGAFVGTAEAAQLLDVSAVHVRRLLDRRELDGRKVGRSWLIERQSVEFLAGSRTRDRRDHGGEGS